MLVGIIVRSVVILLRINFVVIFFGRCALKFIFGCWWRKISLRMRSRFIFSRMAMNFIFGVMMFWRA